MKDASTSTPLKIWTDEDFNVECNQEKLLPVNAKPRRIFKAYVEEWEQAAIVKRDIVNETKLLKKYGGLTWTDPDNNNVVLYSDKKALHWSRVTKKDGGGYCVRAVGPGYDANDPENENHVEPWLIGQTLIGEISHYYRNHPDEGVLVEELQQEKSDDNENNPKGDDDSDSDSDGSSTVLVSIQK